MLFNSYIFILAFLPVVLIGYYLLGAMGLARASIAWLVGASLFFYGWWESVYLLLIGYSILVNFGLGWAIHRAQALDRTSAKILLVIGLINNLGLLGFFKYAMFTVLSINTATGSALPVPAIALPLAISFFTFQQIAYLVDSYRGLTREHNLLNYTLFVTFFPQLIAGPIVHHAEVLKQYREPSIYRFDASRLCIGLTIFAIGLFKKVVFADHAAVYANLVFDEAAVGASPMTAYSWIGALSYTFQLYFDFSGYSDMAIGLGALFGLRLPVNFNSPYKAVSLSDFWRRWHITLSRFLRDYLYIPLGGNRRGPWRRYGNLFITMLLGGLWHGAGWVFVIWGGLHGTWLILQHGWEILAGKPENPGPLRRFFGWALTFHVVVIGWVFFRAADVDTALRMVESMSGQGGGDWAIAEPGPAVAWLIVLAAVAFFAPNTHQLMGRFSPALEKHVKSRLGAWQLGWRPSPAWGAAAGALFLLGLLWISPDNEFIYFQF